MHTDDFSDERIQKTAFFTGHRSLNNTNPDILCEKLRQCITDAYEAGYRRFFCGCALGFDTLAAVQTIRFRNSCPDVRLSLAIPCATQADRWSSSDRETYAGILYAADERIVLSPDYYQGAMMSRNRYMADRSSLCICWLTRMHGGTASAVRYALSKDIRIINLAVSGKFEYEQLREASWNFMFISPFAEKNVGIAPLRLLRGRKLTRKNM